MAMALPKKSTFALGLGALMLIAGVGLIYLGFPTHTTTVVDQQPSEAAMATSLESSAATEIDPIEFATLSPAEQTAVEGAIHSPQSTYTDYGASDDGPQFHYRNDIVNQYFVRYNGSLYLLHVVVEMSPVSVIGGVGFSIVGIGLSVGGVWSYRAGH